ncbi:MAG: TIR domain-containing protein, partial [Deltaproteobacteria bacterium]|nr:TIR domain-containing protein [Deltaproteobacteria bacterium]
MVKLLIIRFILGEKLTEKDSAYKYWAFISYSHQDRQWGEWLHKSLETYSVPRRLVGRPTIHGPVPQRLFPIFRDREELPSSADLSHNIDDALEKSRSMIVICSPRSAASRWVNQEIIKFKALGHEDRILCLIVDGEPNATDKPESGLLECFPAAVRYRINENGELTDERTEPIAADVRPQGDGQLNAKLKMLAGLLGVNFDELKQREKRRRLFRRIEIALMTIFFLCVVAAVWYQGHLQAQENARARYLQLSDLMIQQTKDAIAVRQDAVATVYGAHALRYRLLAGQEPTETDLLSSLTTPGRLLRSLKDAKFAGGLSLNPDGTTLATGGLDGHVHLWAMPGSLSIRTLQGHTAAVFSVSFSPDGRWLASGSQDRTIRLWDTQTWQSVAIFQGHQDRVAGLAFSPDG